MDEFIVIKIMNEATIKVLKNRNEDTSKNERLKEIFSDEALFFKISKERAFQILNCVGVKKAELERVYAKLTNYSAYIKLINTGKIDPKDKDITVKFNNNI